MIIYQGLQISPIDEIQPNTLQHILIQQAKQGKYFELFISVCSDHVPCKN